MKSPVVGKSRRAGVSARPEKVQVVHEKRCGGLKLFILTPTKYTPNKQQQQQFADDMIQSVVQLYNTVVQ